MAVSIVIDVTQNSQSIANNTSNVTVKVNATWTGGSYNLLEKSGSCTINGTKYTFTSPFNTGRTKSGSSNLFTKTLDITHGSDGKKTLAISASYTSGVSSGTVEASANVTLDTIPRLSTLSVSNGTLGTAQTLTISEKASAFVHKLYYTCGNSGTVYILGSASATSTSLSTSWTPPISLAAQNTTGTSVSIKFTLATYSGSTLIGSDSYTKTFTIPSSVKPSCSVTIEDVGTMLNGNHLQGLAKLKITVKPTLSHGSPIASYRTIVNGKTYTSASFTTELINAYGELSITSTVTDKRGRSGSKTETITIMTYHKPHFTVYNASRAKMTDDGPVLDPTGNFIYVTVTTSASYLSGLNSAFLQINYKKSTVSNYTNLQTVTIPGESMETWSSDFIFQADTDASYDVQLALADSVVTNENPITQKILVGTAKVFMSWRKDFKGISFGEVAEEDDVFKVAWKMVSTYGHLISSPVELQQNTDLDKLLDVGYYVISTTEVSSTILNKPPFLTASDTGTASIEVGRMGDGLQKYQRYSLCSKGMQMTFQRIYYSNSWGDWVIYAGCTGWRTLELTSGFIPYGADEPNEPKYRVSGTMVNVKGVLEPTATVTSNTTGVKMASGIAAAFRPRETTTFICQGSGINRWLLTINTSGELFVSRYGTNDYTNIPAGAWLTFNVTYSI